MLEFFSQRETEQLDGLVQELNPPGASLSGVGLLVMEQTAGSQEILHENCLARRKKNFSNTDSTGQRGQHEICKVVLLDVRNCLRSFWFSKFCSHGVTAQKDFRSQLHDRFFMNVCGVAHGAHAQSVLVDYPGVQLCDKSE
jgi:hypothetical protein